MVRPIPCATGIVTVVLIGAFIVATGTPEYIHWSTLNIGVEETYHIGPFRFCHDYEVAGGYADTTCETIPRDCIVTFQRFIPNGAGGFEPKVFPITIAKDCDGFNAFRGLLVMALLIGALSAIIQFAAGCYAFRPHLGTTTAILSGLCGMVSMAIIVAMKDRKDEDILHGTYLSFEIGSSYGYSFIIATGLGWDGMEMGWDEMCVMSCHVSFMSCHILTHSLMLFYLMLAAWPLMLLMAFFFLFSASQS